MALADLMLLHFLLILLLLHEGIFPIFFHLCESLRCSVFRFAGCSKNVINLQREAEESKRFSRDVEMVCGVVAKRAENGDTTETTQDAASQNILKTNKYVKGKERNRQEVICKIQTNI